MRVFRRVSTLGVGVLALAVFSSVVPAAQPASSARTAGPIYVPLDSWVYPALKRLAALGFIVDQPADFGPWTRAECQRQVQEAQQSERSNAEGLRLIHDLAAEFEGTERVTQVKLESLYTRVTGIGGDPLTDSYHFGQTMTNDFGRPYQSGFNSVTGISGYATAGRFSAYLRGEFQQAPGGPANSTAVQDFIASVDRNPVQPSNPTPAAQRFRPLEMYVGVQLGFENVTFGQESLWWGPDTDSAFAFSDNAAPFPMIRFEQQRPFTLPGPLARLAQIRTEIIFGQLTGHYWPARPYVNAQKIALDLPAGLELGFTRSAFFGGAGRPLTPTSFEQSLFSFNSVDFGPYGSADAPGDRHSDFDFNWRIPGLSRLVTVYSDSYADDEPNPISNPKRSAWAPGIYFARIPGLRGFDLRFETYSTWLYRKDEGGDFLYFDNQYHDSYTNDGNLLGSWIGRDSRAYDASTTYWISAKTKIQAEYRQIKAAPGFLPGGGTQTDFIVNGNWAPRPEWLFSGQMQGERYYIPLLGGPRDVLVASLGVTFTPAKWLLKR